ncbi:hypothetical protein B0H13DRAFT_2303406 [Mycena leptocephala]|nr:hypothetical protein B0H13DRAFT_2303406 [Mycena leptocephala]
MLAQLCLDLPPSANVPKSLSYRRLHSPLEAADLVLCLHEVPEATVHVIDRVFAVGVSNPSFLSTTTIPCSASVLLHSSLSLSSCAAPRHFQIAHRTSLGRISTYSRMPDLCTLDNLMTSIHNFGGASLHAQHSSVATRRENDEVTAPTRVPLARLVSTSQQYAVTASTCVWLSSASLSSTYLTVVPPHGINTASKQETRFDERMIATDAKRLTTFLQNVATLAKRRPPSARPPYRGNYGRAGLGGTFVVYEHVLLS